MVAGRRDDPPFPQVPYALRIPLNSASFDTLVRVCVPCVIQPLQLAVLEALRKVANDQAEVFSQVVQPVEANSSDRELTTASEPQLSVNIEFDGFLEYSDIHTTRM